MRRYYCLKFLHVLSSNAMGAGWVIGGLVGSRPLPPAKKHVALIQLPLPFYTHIKNRIADSVIVISHVGILQLNKVASCSCPPLDLYVATLLLNST